MTVRAGGVELRAVVGVVTGTALRALPLLAAAVLSLSIRISLALSEDEAVPLLLFTKRCSFGS
jgi:hypothetical protein